MKVLFSVTWRQKFRPRFPGPGYGTTSDYEVYICTRSICRIGPVTGIGLHVGSTLVVSPTYEPQHYKANKKTCAPSEDSDQPGHPPSLIRVFAVRIMGKDPIFLHADSEDSDQTGRMSRLIQVFAGNRGRFVGLVVPPAAHILSKNEKYTDNIFHAQLNTNENLLLSSTCLETWTISLSGYVAGQTILDFCVNDE